jgi:hypothetical protein
MSILVIVVIRPDHIRILSPEKALKVLRAKQSLGENNGAVYSVTNLPALSESSDPFFVWDGLEWAKFLGKIPACMRF